MPIIIPDENSIPISVRISNNTLTDIDDVVKKLKDIGIKISRNQLIDLMLEDARTYSKVKIGNNEYTFNEILAEGFKAK